MVRKTNNAHPISAWRLIAYECLAAAICAAFIALVTTALDFGAKMPPPVATSDFGRGAELGAVVLLGIFLLVVVRLQQTRGVLHSSLWKREH